MTHGKRPSIKHKKKKIRKKNAKQQREKESARERKAGSEPYSLVSKVTMMRMGRRFIPPTQLELHMKLYRIVVYSVPTCTHNAR